MSERTPSDVLLASAPPAVPPKLAFTDGDGAKRWTNGLQLTNVGMVCETVKGQLQALAASSFSPRERARIAEVLRDLIAYLHTELARRYAGKGQPAADRELEAAEHAIALWQGLWEQYSFCLKPLLEGDPDLSGVKSKILQRGLYVGKQLVLACGLARRTVPASVWNEINAYYRLSEMLDCAVSAVTDDLVPNAVGSSCYSTYSHALLLGLADPWMMSVRQIELTDRWLAMWARKVFPCAEQREAEGPVVLMDLDAGAGAAVVSAAPAKPAESMRFGYPLKLATSVHGRLKRLQSGADPAELQLGNDCSVDQCVALLTQLELRWCQTPRRPSSAPTSSVELCAGGMHGAYYRVAGRTFDWGDPEGRSKLHETRHMRTLGALVDYDHGRDRAERDFPWEQWEGACDSREASLIRVSDAQHRWSLDQLATVHHGAETRVGFVTRVERSDESKLRVSLRLWPGSVGALALRPLSAAGSAEVTIPALIFAATLDERACLILPPRSFNPSRVLCAIDAGPGPERRFRLTKLLQRGMDFERISFEETG